MFFVGQLVAYGIHGVCKIVGIETRKIDVKTVEYFVLEPIRQPGSFFYIPTQNPNALAKLRILITEDQIKESINSDLFCWIDDENQRKQTYREVLCNTCSSRLISAVFVLRHKREELLNAGKKFHMCDENFLRDAERLVYEELSVVLDMEFDHIYDYLQSLLLKV